MVEWVLHGLMWDRPWVAVALMVALLAAAAALVWLASGVTPGPVSG